MAEPATRGAKARGEISELPENIEAVQVKSYRAGSMRVKYIGGLLFISVGLLDLSNYILYLMLRSYSFRM